MRLLQEVSDGRGIAMIVPRLPVPSKADNPSSGEPTPIPEESMIPQSTESWVPDGIRKSRAAFVRDLPELIDDRDLRGKGVACHGDERIGIAVDDEPLVRECVRRGLKADEYIVDIIEPKPTEPEEIALPSSWRCRPGRSPIAP
jgi:hypothetical protein